MQQVPRGRRKRGRTSKVADFARLVVAAETALGFEPGELLQAYNETAKGGAMTARQKLGSIPEPLKNFHSLPDSANVRQPVVEALFSCSSATVWRRVRDGRLPKPRKLAGRGNTWNVGQLRTILPERAAPLGTKRNDTEDLIEAAVEKKFGPLGVTRRGRSSGRQRKAQTASPSSQGV